MEGKITHLSPAGREEVMGSVLCMENLRIEFSAPQGLKEFLLFKFTYLFRISLLLSFSRKGRKKALRNR